MFPWYSFYVPTENLKAFHTIDRNLYAILVMGLFRDPIESMQILALWIWLERVGFYDIVIKMLVLPHVLINELAEEALIFLSCINLDPQARLPEGNEIPLLQSLLDNEIPMNFFIENKDAAIEGIEKVMNGVCIRAFDDVMDRAIRINIARQMAERQKLMAQSIQPTMIIPEFSHLNIGASTSTHFDTGASTNTHFDIGAKTSTEPAQPRALENDVHPDNRTMFITFSKGYPVHEREVLDFFTRTYGDCIESLYMQEVAPCEQSLFARLVFRSRSTIDRVLKGTSKVKFTINGKHVWARKFIPKRGKGSATQSEQGGTETMEVKEQPVQPRWV